MALQKQKFSVSFLQGVDTKSDDKQVVPIKLLELENGILTKTGKIIKRNGYGVLGDKLVAGSAISTYQDELITFDGTDAFSYSANTDTNINKGPLNCIKIDSLPIIRNTFEQVNADSTIHQSGLQVFTWTDARGSCRYSCVDTVTGQIVVSDVSLGPDSINAKPISIGNYIAVFFYDTGTTSIRCLPIPVLTPSTPHAVFDVATDVDNSNPNYDAARIGERAFIAYNSTDGAGSIGILYMNAVLTLSSIVYEAGESASVCITVFGDTITQGPVVSYYNGTELKYFMRDYSLLIQVLAPTVIETVSDVYNITGVSTNNSATIYYTISAPETYNYFIKTVIVDSSGTIGAISVFIRSLSIAGKAFIHDSSPYILTVFDTVLQPTMFLLDSDAIAVAKYAFRVAGGTTVNKMVSNITTVDNINYLSAYTKKDLLDSVNGDVFTQTGVNSTFIRFTADNAFQSMQLGANLHTTGGILQMYDGISFVEHNFNYYPENIIVNDDSASGGITAGTRQYVVTYEWLDNQGQTHRSTTSVPVSVTNTGPNSNNDVVIPTLRLTQKTGDRHEVQIVVYRTVDLGTIFYQVSSISSPLYNDVTVDTVTFHDILADATIIGNNLLYTTGDVVDNTQAEATNIIASFKSRLMYVPAEDPYSYNYSKQTVPTTPVEFYDQQATQIDQLGGKIKAISPLDEKFIFFKESAIFYITGDGPDPTGAQNDFSFPQIITSDGGCVNASSVVTMPLGLMYKSAKGIYLLDRGLNVKYIGKDIEAYNDDTILNATLISNKNQVRFALQSGVVIVYDYLVDQWYTFTKHDHITDAVNYMDDYVYLRTDGYIWRENQSFSDNGNYIKMKIKTAWFSLAGFQAFQRIYNMLVIGNYVSKHKLRLSVSYDFNPVLVGEVLIDAYELLNNPVYGIPTPYGNPAEEPVYGGNWPLYQFRYDFERQKCEAIQLTIEDFQVDNIGEGYQLSAIGFLVGVKEGMNKLSATRKFS